MTIGDLIRYLSMVALITLPVIQLANIGTQITEAFAGLDRIREMMRKYKRMPIPEMIDVSINAVLPRTLMTATTVFLALLSLVFGLWWLIEPRGARRRSGRSPPLGRIFRSGAGTQRGPAAHATGFPHYPLSPPAP